MKKVWEGGGVKAGSGRFGKKVVFLFCLGRKFWFPNFLISVGCHSERTGSRLWLALALAITPSAGLSGHASAEIDNFADEMWKFLANFLFQREGKKKRWQRFHLQLNCG